MSKIRLGLLGCGRVARLLHIDALLQLSGARLVAVAEADPERRREAQQRVRGAAVFEDYRELLARTDLDAVVITLPPALHAESAVAAFEAGRHVYLEKPLATDTGEGRAILAAQARARRLGMIGFNFRFHPLYRALREQLRAGRVGRVVGVRTVFCAAPRSLPPWKTARHSGGGALLDLASHHVDLVRFILGRDVVEVAARVRSMRSEQDTAALQLRLDDGTHVQTFVSMSAAEDDRIEVLGDAGALVADRYRDGRLRFVPLRRRLARTERVVDGARMLAAAPGRLLEQLRTPRDDSHRRALQAFVDAVGRGDPAPVALEDGYRSLAVVLAAETADREGCWVPVPPLAMPRRRNGAEPARSAGLGEARPAAAEGPAMSVVLVTPDRFATIRRTVRFLRAQTVRPRLELILVGPSGDGLAEHEARELDGFFSVQQLAVGPIDNVDRAAARGIARAAAPIVALVEDHAFPDAGWAEALIDAHRGPWAAVGSVVLNANPESPLSWTNLILAYGFWTEPVTGGETAHVSRHNISFKREVLAEFGDGLEALMGRDGGLLQRLQQRGHRFYLEPAARIYHANPSLLASTVELRFNGGRLYGATRARTENWSATRRLLYVAGSPLIPVMRGRPLFRKVLAARGPKSAGLYPAFLMGLALDGLGQAVGYALGPGDTARRLADFEVDRLRHVTGRDRAQLSN